MYCLNHRLGILYRENLSKKSYQIRYFFIDDEANLYFSSSLPRIQKAIRLSKELKDIKTNLLKLGQRSYDLQKYNIMATKQYTGQAVIPFSNRLFFQIKQKQSKGEEKIYQIFGLTDEDTLPLYQQVLHLTGKKKKPIKKRNSSIQENKEKQQIEKPRILLQNFIQNSGLFRMSEQQNSDNQYQGERAQGLAEGKGRQILISKGMTYSGQFRNGKKHGSGYLVNEHLDTLDCQFIHDELSGI